MADEQTRKTVTLSHKQLGGSAALLAVLMGIPQLNTLKEFFTGDQKAAIVEIREDQKAAIVKMDEGFKELAKLISESDKENVVKFRRVTDLTDQKIAATELRCEKNIARLDARQLYLETILSKTRAFKSSTN